MNQRNRSSGWKYAKLSGHTNEENIRNQINDNKDFRKELEILLQANIQEAKSEGRKGKKVESVFQKLTPSKTDLKVISKNKVFNISIKKSKGGQVSLITVKRFIQGMNRHFSIELTSRELQAINLFFGDDPNQIKKIINSPETSQIDPKIKAYERRKQRLTIKSIELYDEDLPSTLLNFFVNYSKEIFLFCFSRGLAANSEDWAEYLWYINTIEECDNYNQLFKIDNIASKIEFSNIYGFGSRGGGTTIQLPFGFVQWHLGQMQFHHGFEKISNL